MNYGVVNFILFICQLFIDMKVKWKKYDNIKTALNQLCTNNEINFIDIDKHIKNTIEDPLSLFPFKRNNHYNSKGHEIISVELSKIN